MRENGVDMGITVNREGYNDPLTEDLGKGYTGTWGYYVFTDRGGDRIERAALGIGTHLLEENGAYDIVTDEFDLAEFVRERDPKAIGRVARDILKSSIRAGRTASDTLDIINLNLTNAGFGVMAEFNKPTTDPEIIDIIVVSHSVGNLGHGVRPSVAFFNPERLTYTIKPTNLLSIELFAYTAIPEWNGGKLRIPLEDDAVVTERGVEWLYPVTQRVLLIR